MGQHLKCLITNARVEVAKGAVAVVENDCLRCGFIVMDIIINMVVFIIIVLPSAHGGGSVRYRGALDVRLSSSPTRLSAAEEWKWQWGGRGEQAENGETSAASIGIVSN